MHDFDIHGTSCSLYKLVFLHAGCVGLCAAGLGLHEVLLC